MLTFSQQNHSPTEKQLWIFAAIYTSGNARKVAVGYLFQRQWS